MRRLSLWDPICMFVVGTLFKQRVFLSRIFCRFLPAPPYSHGSCFLFPLPQTRSLALPLSRSLKVLDRLNTDLKQSEFIMTLGIPIFDEDDPYDLLLIMESTLQFQLTDNIRTDRFRLKVGR